MVVGSTATDFAAVALVDGVEVGLPGSDATGFAAVGSAGEFVVVPVDWFSEAGCATDGFADVGSAGEFVVVPVD